METTMQKAFFCAIFLVLSVLANAQSAQVALKDFGLLGTWAAECKQGPSPGNTHATYSVTSAGAVELKNAFGEGYDDSIYNVSDAKLIAPDRLALREMMVSDKNIVLDIVLLKENGKIRVWSSVHTDGTALVQDGMIAAPVNRETRWVARCG
jgi:hypothetical protein